MHGSKNIDRREFIKLGGIGAMIAGLFGLASNDMAEPEALPDQSSQYSSSSENDIQLVIAANASVDMLQIINSNGRVLARYPCPVKIANGKLKAEAT